MSSEIEVKTWVALSRAKKSTSANIYDEVAKQKRDFRKIMSDKNLPIQAHVYEVTPTEEGCLLRIGMIDAARKPLVLVADDVIRWERSSPNDFDAIDQSEAGNLASIPTQKLPVWNHHQYLVSKECVYKLTGPDLARTVVAKLPKTDEYHGWVGLKVVKDSLYLSLPRGTGLSHYTRLDLRTGKLSSALKP